jgi:hypothetical protein
MVEEKGRGSRLASEKTNGRKGDCRVVNMAETWVGKEGQRRGKNRRTVLIVVVVASVVIGVVLAISLTPVSKLKITLVNLSNQELFVQVWVDNFGGRVTMLEPQESVLFSWDITGWPVHKYDIQAHDPDMLVSYFQLWTHIVVLPFTEKAITLSNPTGWNFLPE